MSPALTWDLCHVTVNQMPSPHQLQEIAVAKRDDYGDPTSLEEIEEDEVSQEEGQRQQQQPAMETGASEWFRSALEAEQVRDTRLDEEDEEQDRDGEESLEQQGEAGSDLETASLHLAKRFGGFMKGRHNYRKLMGRALPSSETESRPLQKRYGGFIGIRKSARKWNSQKRVSQLLRQYLSLTGRTGRFNNLSAPGLRRPTNL